MRLPTQVRAAFFVAAALALPACGRPPSPLSSTDALHERERVLLVILGGNTSCKQDADGVGSPLAMDMHTPFENLRKDLEESGLYAVDYFLSCHNSDAAVHFSASDAPGRLFSTDFTGAQAKIDELFETGAAHRLIMAGHSYGGWLAMKSALVLKEKLATLITIDPISRQCTILSPGNCTQAPKDVTHEQRLTIKGNAGRWLNFWQDQTSYLHSSVIPEADDNFEELVGHTAMDTQADVWDKLGRAIKQAVTRS